MPENSSNISIGESNKLAGTSNYYVWSLKMRAILRRKNQWDVTERKIEPAAFPTNIGGSNVTKTQLRKMKASAMSALVLSVNNDIVDLVAVHTDPADAWSALKNAFQSGDQFQILTLTSQLQTMRLAEGGSVEEYIKKAREIKNRLVSMGESVGDKSMI
jgi:hypothetical protein